MKRLTKGMITVCVLLAAGAITTVATKHVRVIEAFRVAAVGDSRNTIRAWVGAPSFSESLDEKEARYHHAVVSDSYSHTFARYIFYYDASGKLSDKVALTSE